jgi:hypothetical protein
MRGKKLLHVVLPVGLLSGALAGHAAAAHPAFMQLATRIQKVTSKVLVPSTALKLPAGATELDLKVAPGMTFGPPRITHTPNTLPAQTTAFCFANRPCVLFGEFLGRAQGSRFVRFDEVGDPKPLNMPVKFWTDHAVTVLPLVTRRRGEPEAFERRYVVSIRDGAGNAVSNEIRLVVSPVMPPLRPVDADGDGHASIDSGGDDCDDMDPKRYPGNTEIGDPDFHDEDCDYRTFGFVDADGDGHADGKQCNYDPNNNAWHCGTDCDDGNPAIYPGEQACDPRAPAAIFVCDGNGGEPARWRPYSCANFSPATRCVAQPNKRGTCVP